MAAQLLIVLWLGTVLAPITAPTGAHAQSRPGEMSIPRFGDPRGNPEKPSKTVRKIRFLTGDGFPPFNFIDNSGRLTGFNVELARAICRRLKAVCTIQAEPFASLTVALGEDKGDAIIAGLVATPALRRTLGFTLPYLRLPGRFAVGRDTAIEASAVALRGKRISVAGGTAHEAYLKAFFRGSEIAAYKTVKQAKEVLKSGQVAAYFGDGMALSFWLNGEASQNCCRFSGGPYLEQHFFGDGLTIAVPLAKTNLLANLNHALAAIIESPEFIDLYQRFFPIGFF